MTNYDKLIDAIVNELYQVYYSPDDWNEDQAKKNAHKILEIVEEFQSVRSKAKWRASD